VGLGKRPCDKISVKYVTPKISCLIERDYYRKKNDLWTRREHCEVVTGLIIKRKSILGKCD